MTDELYELPDGWKWTTLENLGAKQKNAIVDGPFGSNLKLTDYIEDRKGVPVLTTKNLNGDYSPDSVRFISRTKFEELKRSEVRSGDILVAKIGSCGKTGIYPDNMPSAIIPANLLKMTVDPSVSRDFVYHYLNSPTFQDLLKEIISATAQPAFGVTKFKQLLAPLPPLPEQQRIVAKIESLFAESRTARDALKRVPALLKRFRQSVLASAFRGELSERDPNDEPAFALLERVGATLGGRPMRGRAEPRGTGQPHRVAPTNADDLPELPDGWVWTTVSEITKNFDGRRVPVKETNRKNLQGKYPYYGASGIIDHVNDFLFDGTYLLVGEDGANLLSRSTPIAFQASGKFWVNNHAHVLQTVDEIPLAYLEHYFNRIDLSQYVTGTAQPKLTQAHMNGIPVPLAPLAEQRRIVAKIEALFAQADAIERAVAIAQQRAEKIDQAILARAFRGEL